MKWIKSSANRLLLISCAFLAACQPDSLQPAQDYTQFQTFTQVDIGSGFAVEIQPGPTRQITISTTADQQRRLSVTETGNLLSIHLQGSRGGTQPLVRITLPVLSDLTLEGHTQATVGLFELHTLQLQLSGGSSLTMTGQIGELAASLTGSSTYNGFDAPTQEAVVNLSGGSKVQMLVVKKLKLTASGGSVLQYKGSATIEQTLLGGSKLIFE